MRTLKYILVGQTPVPVNDTLEWAHWFETADESRIVKQDTLGKYWVSTIFLGLDHDFLQKGPPILFETMVFRCINKRDGTVSKKPIYQNRCSTWLEAEQMHAVAVDLVVRKRLVRK